MHGMTKPELPEWVSAEVFRYLEHTVAQVSIRELARKGDCHPSTVLRQIRRLEQRREDPLVDGCLQTLSDAYAGDQLRGHGAEIADFSKEVIARCLSHLAQPGAVLVAGRDMEKAVVVRDVGTTVQKSIVDRHIVEMLALVEWISCFASGQVYRYRITKDGRTALAEYLAEVENQRRRRAETLTQSGISGVIGAQGREDIGPSRRARYGLQETPLQTLSRLTDRDGNLFLSPEMVRAGERLREDFELAQIGQHIASDGAFTEVGATDRCVTAKAGPTREAFQRAAEALCALGPGLSDIALRCCCHLEGLEAAEKELGWSARSGKIVLRIALEQLHQYYSAKPPQNVMIG
ncbi:DUF6456 domain-containing protein [Arenibacterium sp. LLYu02]|uniref:DUF6456 domain-containing protein n=1 Tax=Arenibacterium sp. LLYu02 TaxID=3404132 RepID=UPI003B2286EA